MRTLGRKRKDSRLSSDRRMHEPWSCPDAGKKTEYLILPKLENRLLDRLAHSKLLYRLSYPGMTIHSCARCVFVYGRTRHSLDNIHVAFSLTAAGHAGIFLNVQIDGERLFPK
jgi:hypothetical protein